jgi:hypothetical protein
VAERVVAELVVSGLTCIVDTDAKASDDVDLEELLGHLDDGDAAKEEDSGHISLSSH